MNKIIVFLICNLLIFSTTALALTPLIRDKQKTKQGFFNIIPSRLPQSNTWIKTYGFGYNCGYSVQQTSDGGYIFTGLKSQNNTNRYDVLLIKTNDNGKKIWAKTFGGEYLDYGYSVQQTTDGGYIITGITRSYGSGEDVWLIKTDINGEKIWDKTFEGSYNDGGYSVQQTTDAGYIITGNTNYYDISPGNIWLIKTDAYGEKVWDKTFGGLNDENGYSIQQTSDNGYIIAGETNSFGAGGWDFWFIKTDSNGIEEWNRTFGEEGDDRGSYVQQTTDGGYIITGSIFTNNTGKYDIWLIKTDSNGNEEWNRKFGQINYSENSKSIQQTTDLGYIITGYTSKNNCDFLLIKTDINGYEIWNMTYGGEKSDCGYSGKQTTDSGYIIVGNTYSYGNPYGGDSSTVWLIKTDSHGKSKNISLDILWFEKLVQRFPFFEKILKNIQNNKLYKCNFRNNASEDLNIII